VGLGGGLKGAENLASRRPARSEWLYRLRYPDSQTLGWDTQKIKP